MASALSNVLLRDGRAPMTGPLNMNGQVINNVATGNTPASVATLAQSMPIGAVIDYAGGTAPAGWVMCWGQAINRSTYAQLFGITSTLYGAGDGSTTFNVPDLRGRVVAGRDNATANRLTIDQSGIDSNNAGSAGGVQSVALNIGQMPSHAHTGVTGAMTGNQNHSHGGVVTAVIQVGTGGNLPGGGSQVAVGVIGNSSSANIDHGHTITLEGGGLPHINVQPTFILNKIMRASYDV